MMKKAKGTIICSEVTGVSRNSKIKGVMKRSSLFILLVSVLIITGLITGCSKDTNNTNNTSKESEALDKTTTDNDLTTQTNVSDNSMTLVVGETSLVEYKVNLDECEVSEGLISILDYLKENEGLEYESTDGGYGAYLTKVGSLAQDDSAGQYIYIFTSVAEDADVSAYATTMDYDDIKLTSSGVGASEMHINKDCIIYISTTTY